MRRLLALIPAISLLVSCAPSANTLYVTMETYISAVSLNDVSRALASSAPYQRELNDAATSEEKAQVTKRYEGMMERGYMLWEQAKSMGEMAPDPMGVALIRGIGLGREGAAAMPIKVRFDAGNTRAVITSRAITNYDRIPWGNLPSGGRMYLLGYPFGKVVNFATGYDDPSTMKLLATVDLEWTLVTLAGVKRPDAAPSDWYVEKVEARPDTATSWSPPASPPS